MIDSRSARLQTIVQGECVKEVVEIWSQYFFSCSEVKQLGTGYVHNKIAGFYRKATRGARESEKKLRQVQRRLYAEIITCRKKSAREYAQSLMANRYLFELEPGKFEQAKLVNEKRKIPAKEQDDQNANISLKGKVGKPSSEVLKKPAFQTPASESQELKFQRGDLPETESHSKTENPVKLTEAKARESSIHGSLDNGISYKILEKDDTRKRIYHKNRKSFAFTWPTKSYPNKVYGKYGHRKDYHLKNDGKVKHQHSSLFCRKSRSYVGFKNNKMHRMCRSNTIENGEISKKLDFYKEEWVQCEVNHPIKQSKYRIPLPIHKLGSQNESNIEAHLKRIGAYKKTETNKNSNIIQAQIHISDN
ncbi:uncharacterized protein LOC135693690 [Rhopilema esculentum]|uniref:uncharacterized protein LOC135693690 n=1 Tax=Rhopilema esculentum TaxID=499914 RepID=UPI0031D41106